MEAVLKAQHIRHDDHEVVSVFKRQGMPLSVKLVEMLNEHFLHQSERRGCGYTQATRVLAEYINQPRSLHEFDDLKLFEDATMKSLREVMVHAQSHGLVLNSWRNLDIHPSVREYLQQHDPASSPFAQALHEQVEWQHQLRHIHAQVGLEESLLIVAVIQDIILPPEQAAGLTDLPVLLERPKVGSCPMAEKFFLEIAYYRVARRGLVNVFVDANNRPLLIEKINMGDDHSCISLETLLVNGVRVPAGSSFAVAYDDERVSKLKAKGLAGFIMPVSEIEGFWFLRLTTLVVSPQNRKRAFSTHFSQQVEKGLFSPDVATLSQLREVAARQVTGA
ncbi:hypothetical protein [Aquirhabdus sp.]|uniref:hypothetical protein n=1 Tax=Aquirhabdus sp. TaxID=2824160 RepID=UPI00396CC759